MDRRYIGLIMRRLFALFLFAVLCVACESKIDVTEVETVEVSLSLSGAPMSRSDSPLIPDVENLVYDVWILQYDNMGLLIDAGTSHARATNSGSLTAIVSAELAVGEDCTICFLANLDRGNPSAVRTWPQTLNEFKTSVNVVDLSADIATANDGTLTDMPMFGYWEGDISIEVNNIQVSLGRMLTRINLMVNNRMSSGCVLSSISNIPTKVYAFPDVNHAPLPEEAYVSVYPVNVSVASGESKELYFYTAPNFTADQTRATVLCIEGKEPVILSNGAPDTANRDYNLYHNSNYTFTINVN